MTQLSSPESLARMSWFGLLGPIATQVFVMWPFSPEQVHVQGIDRAVLQLDHCDVATAVNAQYDGPPGPVVAVAPCPVRARRALVRAEPSGRSTVACPLADEPQ